jgi:hypothetical protein
MLQTAGFPAWLDALRETFGARSRGWPWRHFPTSSDFQGRHSPRQELHPAQLLEAEPVSAVWVAPAEIDQATRAAMTLMLISTFRIFAE